MSKKLRIGFVGGSWSSNIGNAFYNLGTEALLRSIPGVEPYFFPDPPHWKEIPKDCFDLLARVEVDCLILTGPCLNLKLRPIFERTFQVLKRRRVPIGFLSAGMSLYDEGEATTVRNLLTDYPPDFVFTRDTDTFDLLGEIKNAVMFDGLCTSAFLNDAVDPPALAGDPFYVFNFDTAKNEPFVSLDGENGFRLGARMFGKPQVELNGTAIVRTNNCAITDGYTSIYRRPNTYHSDLPFGYLSILRSAKAVLSERVHTCAATLVLGGTAQYFAIGSRSREKRIRLLASFGAESIQDQPTKLCMQSLEVKKSSMRGALCKAFVEKLGLSSSVS